MILLQKFYVHRAKIYKKYSLSNDFRLNEYKYMKYAYRKINTIISQIKY